MPQLDKYIFLNEIVLLTVYFLLIYLFTRGSILPKIHEFVKYELSNLRILTAARLGYIRILLKCNWYYQLKTSRHLFRLLRHLNVHLNQKSSYIKLKISSLDKTV